MITVGVRRNFIGKFAAHQMQTIRQLMMFQNKETIFTYLEHLLAERTFIQSSIEVHEPILQAFLQKERHIIQSFGIALLVKCEGHYCTPASISAYQLIRILKELLNSAVDALKQEDVKTLTILNHKKSRPHPLTWGKPAIFVS